MALRTFLERVIYDILKWYSILQRVESFQNILCEWAFREKLSEMNCRLSVSELLNDFSEVV